MAKQNKPTPKPVAKPGIRRGEKGRTVPRPPKNNPAKK